MNSMYSAEILIKATRLRTEGVPIKEIAARLTVSVGWVSTNLRHIAQRPPAARVMLSASAEAFAADHQTWGQARAENAKILTAFKTSQRLASFETMSEATTRFTLLPDKGTRTYKMLDKLQQLFAKDPDNAAFALMPAHAPALLSHLIEWTLTKHGVSQDKSDVRFEEHAKLVRDHVISLGSAPSTASGDPTESAAARWLSRWKSNAIGKGERKKNITRAGLILDISRIIDGLRSPYPDLIRAARKSVANGEWTALFDRLIATKNSYACE